MSDITIGALQLANTHNYSAVAGAIKLRIWFTGCQGTNFQDSLGNIVMCGSGANGFFLEVPVTLAGTTLSIPSYILPSTDNSSQLTVVAHAQFYVNGAAKHFLFQNWIVPNALGASISYDQLFDYNLVAITAPNSGTTTFLAAISALIAASVGALVKATNAVFGLVRLSVAALNPLDPIAVGDNDPRFNLFRSSDYATLNAAVAAIGATAGTLQIVAAQFPSGTSCTVPATLVLDFGDTGTLLRASGQVTTIQSDGSQWPNRHLFLGTGTVSFSGNFV